MRDWLATTGNSEVKLSSMERDAVSTALFLYLREKPKTLLVGPRSVRAFVFRYQFVRLILSKRGIIAFNPGDVISDLAQKTFDTPNASTPTSSKDPRIAAILEMVS